MTPTVFRPAGPFDILLTDPGLVVNSEDEEHCVHACFQMIFRTKTGGNVPSFAELDILMQKMPGKYTWEYGLLGEMGQYGFETEVVWTLDLELLRDDPESCILQHFGKTVGGEYVANTDLSIVSGQAARLLQSKAHIQTRVPELPDVLDFLTQGFYITVTINQRILQADPGYAAHSIFIYGAGPRGIRVHNPGPPASRSSEIPWDLFDKAWSFPDESVRNIMALRPNFTQQ